MKIEMGLQYRMDDFTRQVGHVLFFLSAIALSL